MSGSVSISKQGVEHCMVGQLRYSGRAVDRKDPCYPPAVVIPSASGRVRVHKQNTLSTVDKDGPRRLRIVRLVRCFVCCSKNNVSSNQRQVAIDRQVEIERQIKIPNPYLSNDIGPLASLIMGLIELNLGYISIYPPDNDPKLIEKGEKRQRLYKQTMKQLEQLKCEYEGKGDRLNVSRVCAFMKFAWYAVNDNYVVLEVVPLTQQMLEIVWLLQARLIKLVDVHVGGKVPQKQEQEQEQEREESLVEMVEKKLLAARTTAYERYEKDKENKELPTMIRHIATLLSIYKFFRGATSEIKSRTKAVELAVLPSYEEVMKLCKKVMELTVPPSYEEVIENHSMYGSHEDLPKHIKSLGITA